MVLVLVEDADGDLHLAQHGKFHSLAEQSLLTFQVGDTSAVLVLDSLSGLDLSLAHKCNFGTKVYN